MEKFTITLSYEKELVKLGHQFFTQTDTEVILVAYKEWGTACVSKFNGMWAFAIHDVKNGSCFLLKGQIRRYKVFYYTIIDNKFLFASEIKQFSAILKKK